MACVVRSYHILSRIAKLRGLTLVSSRQIFANNSWSFQSKFSASLLSVRQYAKGGGGGGKKPSKKGSKGKLLITDEELSEIVDVSGYRNQLEEILNKMKTDFVENLSIRSSAGAIESLKVKIEGDEFPLNEIAQISRKNPNLIALNLTGYPDGLKPTLQAIYESGLGLNPQQEGTMIYLPIPKVNRELREQLAKNAKVLFVKSKDDIRDIQNAYIKDTKQKGDLPEDLVFGAQNKITSIAEEFSTEAEKMMKTKQKELLGET